MLLNCGVEKTLESPSDCKEIQPVHPKGNQSWIFIGRADAEAEAPRLWPPDVKSRLNGKDPDAGKDRRQEEKEGMTEDKMFGWHHQLNGHEFEQALGEGEGQEEWFAIVHGVAKSLAWLSEQQQQQASEVGVSTCSWILFFYFFIFIYLILFYF